MTFLNPYERPSALPAVWTQVSGVRIRSASLVARDLVVGRPPVRTQLAADVRQLPQVHQVQSRAALARAQAQMVRTAGSYGINGTTGFRGDDLPAAKRTVDVISGAPPRGRPV